MAAFERSPEVVFTEVEDGAVLLDMKKGLYYSLNDVGTEIWRVIDPSTDSDDLTRALTLRFDVDAERAKTNAQTFVDALARADLIVQSEDGGAPSDSGSEAAPTAEGAKRPFSEPALVQHDEPLHEVATSPFDAQLPLAE